jgi:cytoskeletal protein CcmA (bactofilin family)
MPFDLFCASTMENLMLTIEADMIVQGDLLILGTVRLEGRFEGTIMCNRLEIGVDGYVEGRVFTEQLTLAGQIVGLAHARVVHLLAGAILEGELVHEQLRMDEAATLVGESRRHKGLGMPSEFSALQAKSKRFEDDFRNLETAHRVKRADEAVTERVQYDALRARFPVIRH